MKCFTTYKTWELGRPKVHRNTAVVKKQHYLQEWENTINEKRMYGGKHQHINFPISDSSLNTKSFFIYQHRDVKADENGP